MYLRIPEIRSISMRACSCYLYALCVFTARYPDILTSSAYSVFHVFCILRIPGILYSAYSILRVFHIPRIRALQSYNYSKTAPYNHNHY